MGIRTPHSPGSTLQDMYFLYMSLRNSVSWVAVTLLVWRTAS